MAYEWEKRRQKTRREGRRWLLASLRKHMLPALIERGFAVAPLVLSEPDRELQVQQPLGRLTRPRAGGVDHVQIELAPYTRPAFRLSAGAAPKEGVVGVFGPVPAEDV